MNMTRRQLAQMTAMGVASQVAAAAQEEGRRIGYAVIGLGRITGHFMPACKMSKHAKVTAMVTGHPEKAAKLAPEYGISEKGVYSYENFDRIVDNKDVDAVYIGLPNSMHAEYTIRAAKAGKHVLCEKPMATTIADAKSMLDACKKADKKLMIAYRCQFEPTHLKAIELIKSGKLGKVQAIESANGFNIRAGEWRLDGKLAGGGPLMDMGVYSLNACRYLLGEEPLEIKAVASVIDQDGRFKDVEENLSWSMKFPSGAVASCNTSYGCNMPGFVRVHGSRGMLTLEPAFGYQGIKMNVRIQGEQPMDVADESKDPAQFVREADYFADAILQNKPVQSASGEDGFNDMKHVMEIYKSAGRRFS
jgi:predicted dehydrogenase